MNSFDSDWEPAARWVSGPAGPCACVVFYSQATSAGRVPRSIKVFGSVPLPHPDVKLLRVAMQPGAPELASPLWLPNRVTAFIR